jgi:hypothetical protein
MVLTHETRIGSRDGKISASTHYQEMFGVDGEENRRKSTQLDAFNRP